jgi:polygalacturonase
MAPRQILNSRRGFLGRLVMAGGAAAAFVPTAVGAGKRSAGSAVNVLEFGARGDGKRLATRSLQAAIDACAQHGGGTVWFPAGTYLSGTLRLRSRVTLHLDAGATLMGSPRLADYPVQAAPLRSYTDNYTERSLIYGENLEQVSLHGRGTIDGQGARFPGEYKVRPFLVRMISCRDIAVRDLTLRDSPMWVQHYLACDDLVIDGLRIRSRCNGNNDGIDIDGCQRVRIANCDISSGDDAIVLKSTLDRLCRDVVISNCVLSSACNAFKLGTESNGGFANIAFSNCVIYDTRLAGIALELVDGGSLDRVSIANVIMQRARGAIFVRLGNRARPFAAAGPKPGQGSLRRVTISQVQATEADAIGCSITGLPGACAQDISLDQVAISFAGGGKRPDAAADVPEHAERYPEYSMFGVLPAYGFTCRHVRGLRLRDVRVGFTQAETRPSLFCEDVEDLDLRGWEGALASPAVPVVHFRDVRRALVHGCRSPQGAMTYLRVEGAASAGIKLLANDLGELDQPVALGPNVAKRAVVGP